MTSLRKQCSKCGRVLLIENFSKNPSNSDGLRNSCKKCDAQYRREWQKNGGAEYMRIYAKANPVKVITSSLVSGAKARAKDKNLPFDIDLDYVRSMVGENAELAFHCPVFGIPLDWSRIRNNGNRPLPNSPSIDRIDPERGYVKGNIKIISFRANQIKSDGSPSELKLVAAYCAKALVDSLEF
jgi:hypothetical protein